MRHTSLGLAQLICCLFSSVVQAAPVLQVDITTGTLTGASNVEVNGLLYDVTFVEGTCTGVFSGCDSAGDFDFLSYASGSAAAAALLETVLIDIPGSYDFDTFPDRTFGCGTLLATCNILVPTAIVNGSVQGAVAVNNTGAAQDLAGGFTQWSPTYDTAANDNLQRYVWSVWSRTNAVPEPGSLALLSLGLAGLALNRRRKVARAAPQ